MHMTAARPLLFLDSGIGGLTIADAARMLMPQHSQIYVADYAGYPYGTKTEEEIVARLPILLKKLAQKYDPAVITIACNTASTISLDAVRDKVDIPVVGTVPAIKPAAQITKSNVIGVLGTKATVRQPYVANLAKKFAPNAHIIHHGGTGLVTLAEALLRGEKPDKDAIHAAIAPMMDDSRFQEMDVLVLSCTHFPLLKEALAPFLPESCAQIDGAKGIARRIKTLLADNGDLADDRELQPCENIFLTTGQSVELTPYKKALNEIGFATVGQFCFGDAD